MQQADIGIINTCAFIHDSKVESVDAILELADLKKRGRLKKIIVYGCLPQRYRQKLLRELPEVDAFVGRVSLNHDVKRFSCTPGHFAYVKICEGCINNCSYCVIPKIKGKFTSLDMDTVLARVRELDGAGVSEINIVGQDITGYGIDLYGGRRLPQLLHKIIQDTQHVSWIRLLYMYPSRIDAQLLDMIKDQPRVCKYIDLPIQHVSDRNLKLMHRGTTKKQLLTLINQIRKKIPEAAIRTSVIVGFPSETEKEFRELLKFIAEARFERLGAFVYSREEGTRAYRLKRQVPTHKKRERFHELMSLQQKVSEQVNERFIGRDMTVLIDEEEKRGLYLGRSEFDAPEVDGLVYINSRQGKRLKPGDFVRVKITDTLEYDLIGELI